MAESERGVQTATIEGEYFDSVVASQGDFNPFAARGWQTLRNLFKRRVAHSTTKSRLLEIGCGTGQSYQIYDGLISFHVGIDLSESAVRVAARNFPQSHWMRGDACQLPFADDSFDIIAFSSVLHHIPDYGAAVKEAARVLRPGGRVFAFDPNLLHPGKTFAGARSATVVRKRRV
jgi:ubiquinone/menaquinone biosynthesis C-methylase UbiE